MHDSLIFGHLAAGLHGVPETEADTTAAALHIIDQHLDIKLPSDAIDRSHRLGRTTGEVPRPIIMKFVSYQACGLRPKKEP